MAELRIVRFFRAWQRWHHHWDELCSCCGKCCYSRRIEADGDVTVLYDHPCEHLNTETNLCNVYPDRFRKCSTCGKVGLFTALFNPTLPKDCTYVRVFRVWEKQ